MAYKLGSLFDGSGGFPLAGSLCGIEPVWAAEVEPYPIAVTRSRFPNMKHLGSVTDIHGGDIEPVDIITFGSPCQDLSVAGKRAGLKHTDNGDEETTRSGLFMEDVRIIKEMREATNGEYPRFALWENVPGAFSSNKGEDFRLVCEELIKVVEPAAVMPAVPKNGWPYADSYIGDGWSLAYRVFDAQYWGVPQRRRRIHLIVDFRGKCAREVLFEREGVRGYFAEGRTPWQSLAGDAQNCTGADDRAGDGAGRTGRGLDAVAYTLKIRSGCEGGGKGALVQEDKSATLATNNDQYLFQPVGLIDSIGGQAERGWEGDVAPCLKASHYKFPPVVSVPVAGFCTEHSAKARGVGYQKEVAPTLRAGVTPACVYAIENHPADSRVSIDESGKVQTLTSRMGTGGGNVPMVMEPIVYDGANVTSPVNASNPQPGDPCHTLSTDSRNYVCYAETYQKTTGPLMANSHPGSYSGQDAYTDMFVVGKEVAGVDCRNMNEYPDLYPTLQAKPNGGQSLNFSGAVRIRYIVRRLTPTECARLQGFADRWGDIDQKDDFSNEEYRFWLEVRNTHAVINGKPVKEYTKTQMLTWYNKLHTDSSEYKMWGNGIALPPALYVLQGMMEALTEEGEDDWML